MATSVPPSDPGDLEETRAALLGSQYWNRTSPLRSREAAGPSNSGPGSDRDDPHASSSVVDTLRQPSPSFAAPTRTVFSSPPLGNNVATAVPSSSVSTCSSRLPSPAKAVFREYSPVRLASPVSSAASDHVLRSLVHSQEEPLGTARSHRSGSPSFPETSPSRPRIRSRASRSSSATPPKSPDPVIIPPDQDPPPAGRALRRRTAAQLKPYSTEQQRYTINLLRNGWEGAVVRGLPRGHDTEGPEEIRRRKELLEEAERQRRESLGGWLVDPEEDGSASVASGGTPREGTHGGEAKRRKQRRATSAESYRSALSEDDEDDVFSEGEDDDVGLDGTALLEQEARRKDRMRRLAIEGKANGTRQKRRYSPHRYGLSCIDDPRRPLQGAAPSHRYHQVRKSARVATKPRDSTVVGDEEEDESSGEVDSLSAPDDVGRPSVIRATKDGRRGKRKRWSDQGPDRAHRPSVRRATHRAESAPPSSSAPHSPCKHRGRKRLSRQARNDTMRIPAVVGFAKRPRGMAEPAGSLRGRWERRLGSGDGEHEHELRGLSEEGASSEGNQTEGEETIRGRDRARSRAYTDGTSPSRSSSTAVESASESDIVPAPRLEVRGKRRRALGAMMPAVFLKKAVADLKLMQREREYQRRGGSGEYDSDEDEEGDGVERDWDTAGEDELNSGDEEALERERRERQRAKKRQRSHRRDGRPTMLEQAGVLTDESGSEPNRSEDDQDTADEEANAVASWLNSFAPRRGGAFPGAAAEEDVVDRFLRRARRPPKARSGNKRRPNPSRPKQDRADASAKNRAAVHAETASTSHGPHRGVLRDSGNYVAGHRPLDGRSSIKRQRPKPIALDSDEAVFAFAALPEIGDDSPDVVAVEADLNVVTSPRHLPLRRSAPKAMADFGIPAPVIPSTITSGSEIWASFDRFSHDFDLHRLPAGVRLAGPDSLVSNGYLFSLFDRSALTQGAFSADGCGCTLTSSMDVDELSALIPTVCDGAHDVLSAAIIDDDAINPLAEVTTVLRFFGHWFSTQKRTTEVQSLARFGSTLLSHLDRLETRLTALNVPESAVKRFRLYRSVVSWHVVDLAARVQDNCGLSTVDSSRFEHLVAVAVRRLIDHGVDRTMRSLKAAKEPGSTVTDVTVEAWLGLVSLAVRSGQINSDGGSLAFNESALWRTVLEETRAALVGTRAARGPAGGEVVSYTAMMLCAVSQFSPSGVSGSRPQLGAHWPALLATLESIQPSALALRDHSLSSTAIVRRDRYLWTLFARCLVFVERWGWIVDIRDELLPRLFDLLNARRLADLTTEPGGDFPVFLQNLDRFDEAVALDEKRDTAFSIFLKLVIAAAAALPASTEPEQRRRDTKLTRLFLRLSPMLSSAWSRHSMELTSRGPSVLVNHYSLHLAFAVLLPSAAPQRIEQAARLIAFAQVDDEARKSCIRAAYYFGLVARSREITLAPVVDWLAALMTTLTSEYGAIERERRKKEGLQRPGPGSRAPESTTKDALWTRAIMITMVLRSVQAMTRWKRPRCDDPLSFPDLALLHPAWTSQLLGSPLALDPMIGREAIQTIECFLQVRGAAMSQMGASKVTAAEASKDGSGNGAGESQDDFGLLDDLDFDDPALNAMLGIEGSGNGGLDAAVGRRQLEGELRSKDKRFAELLQSTIAPAFFRLVSNIFVDQSSGGPTVIDRVSFAQTAVECWTKCLAVAVENQIADWRPYLQYGDQSWKRLSDPIGRRHIGLFLIIQVLQHDPAVYSVFTDDVLEIFFESIVAKRLTSQHVLLGQLLNMDRYDRSGIVSPLLEGLPFSRIEDSGCYDIQQLDLLDKRMEVISVLFRNAARIVVGQESTGLQAPTTQQLLHRPAHSRSTLPRSTILNFLRGMLTAMRDNLGALHDEASRGQYASFVKLVLESLTSAGGTPGSGGLQQGRRGGPFDELTLPDVRALRSAVA